MKLKISLLTTTVLIPIISPLIMFSCSSTDQNYIDEFYKSVVEKKDWVEHSKIYASSIYNLDTFEKAFPSVLKTEGGFVITLEDIIPTDANGSSNYTVYLRDEKTKEIYWPTPTVIGTEINGDEIKESVTSFNISNFKIATLDTISSFNNKYKLIDDVQTLNAEGKSLFNRLNIEEAINFDDPGNPNYIGKLFDLKNPIPPFEISSYEKISADNDNKELKFKIYLKNELEETMGPGKIVTLK